MSPCEPLRCPAYAIADGNIDVPPWPGQSIGLGEVAQSVAEMSGTSAPIRTVIDPRRA